MDRRKFIALLGSAAIVRFAGAQQTKIYRIGVILEGGPYFAAVDGLRDGLKERGFGEGEQYILEIRDLKGDRRAAEAAARRLEQERVDLIYTIATSVTAATKRATTKVPIVFTVGEDPVVAGLVENFARPGGRLTGVYRQGAEVVAKSLEILKAILPDLHRVVTFYDPSNAAAIAEARSARAAAQQFHVELIERHVASVEELRLAFQVLQAQEAEAYYYVGDAMVLSQAQFIIDMARAKGLPTVFTYPDLAKQGALVGYGVNFAEAGRASAKYVHRVLTGTSPQDLPVELLSRVELAVNLKTAKALRLTIPQSLLLRADEVIQ